jgi:transcriptional regulator with XRE-family HTH domain
MANSGSPLVYRRRLRAELRRTRQARGLTQEQVARGMDWSLSKVIRIEAMSSGISGNDLMALLDLYGVTEAEQVNSFLVLARAARERSWWSAYRDVASASLLQLIEHEALASSVRQFEAVFIPGLLQTEEYAHAVIQDYYDDQPRSERVRALVELRVRRGELLEGEGAPAFYFMLDEAAVRRSVGGSSIMKRQLRRLAEMSERPNVEVEIIPFSAGLHAGIKGPFVIMEFTDPLDSDVIFLESPRGDIVSSNPEEALLCREAFEMLGRKSLGPANSRVRLAGIAEEMS